MPVILSFSLVMMSPLLVTFAVTLHSLIERIKTSIPNLNLNVWYLADGTLMGSPDNLAAALHIIESLGPSRITPQLEQIPPLHPRISGRPILSTLLKSPPLAGFFFSFLGCPVGPPDYCEVVFQVRLAKLQTTLDAVHDMGDSQLETTLLRSCLALPKAAFILRVCPPSCHVANTTRAFDAASV